MPAARLSDNSKFQLTLGIHFALLVLLAATHRQLRAHGWYELFDAYRLVTGICAGVFLAQICLVGCWAAFSQSSSALRIGLLVLFAPLLAAVQSQVFNETNLFVWWFTNAEDTLERYTIWCVELSLFAMLVATCGFTLRCAGLRVISSVVSPTGENAWQFRLSDIVGWIVVMALLLAAGRWLQDYGWNWRRGRQVAEWALRGNFWAQARFAGLGALLAAGLLGFKSARYGLALMILTPLVFSMFDNVLTLGRPVSNDPSAANMLRSFYSADVMAIMVYVFAAVFGGTLLVVRDCGYRLSWRKPWTSPPVAEST